MIMIDINNPITEPFIRDAKCHTSEETDLEKGTQVLQSNSDFGMDKFNKQIEEAEIQVDKLFGLLINLKTLLKDANKESKSATNTSGIKAIKKQMEKYIDDVGKNVGSVREKLQVTTIDNILHRQMPGCQKGTALDRELMNVTNDLTRKLEKLLMEFEDLRQTIQDEYSEVVGNCVITVADTRPEEMIIDHLMETGNKQQKFPTTFEQKGRGKVFSTMEEEIQERLDAIKEFEKRFLEPYQLYLKTAVVVEGHAKTLDKLENQVTDAVDRIRKIDLNQNVQILENKSRNYLIYGICFMMVLVIINVLSKT